MKPIHDIMFRTDFSFHCDFHRRLFYPLAAGWQSFEAPLALRPPVSRGLPWGKRRIRSPVF